MAAEYTAPTAQSVAVGSNVLWTTTVVSPCSCYIRHREGSGLITLRGKGIFEIFFSANITVATAGTEAVLSVAVDGEPLASSTMIVTPAVSGDLNNVSCSLIVDVPCGCCAKVSVQNTGTLATTVQNANISVAKVG